ncbi:MAG: class I SAM-dependent methyltransferase [Candidatus Omnitrophica bacterium]|nr:class I SAM-dependent methyltransferase [Candidatus Omnitrophota bacterium]
MPRKLPFIVFFLSLSVLIFEISLVRIFSVLMRYHYVFLIVSMSMCGLGIGGLVAFYLMKESKNLYPIMFFILILTTITMPLSVILIFKTPLRDFLSGYTTISLIPFIPFLFAGAFFSYVFTEFGRWSGKIYFADLLGAGTGCILTIPLMKIFGGINIIFLSAIIVAMASLLFADSQKSIKIRMIPTVLVFLMVCFTFFNRDNKIFSIPYIKDNGSGIIKPLFTVAGDLESKGRIVYTEWNSFARTDLVEFFDIPDIKYIYTDGDVPTTMHYFNGDLRTIDESIKNTVFSLPFADLENPKVLSIGPGGGLDILVSILGGSKDIIGVEVNPSIFSIMDRYAFFNGNLYKYPGVKVYLDDGRSFVKRTKEKYDLIFLALTQSATSQSTSGVLTEGYIHTKEAFTDYLEKLNQDGMIVFITQNELLLLRGFSTFLSILNQPHKSGLSNLMVFMVGEEQFETTPYRYILIVGKSALTKQRQEKIKNLAEKIGVIPVLVPDFVAKPPFDTLGNSTDYHKFVSEINRRLENPVNIFPVSDDNPFFLDLSFGVPGQFKKLLFLVILITLILAGWLGFRDLKNKPEKKDFLVLVFVMYFAIIGTAYMIIEVALIQKFILFLGHPTFAVSVVLFSLLAASSVGSLVSQRWKEKLLTKSALAALFTFVLIMVYTIYLHRIFEVFLYHNRITRTLLSVFLILPAGFFMGIPFPNGIRIVKQFRQDVIPWLWAINGLMSVCGSVIAVIVAKIDGFTSSLLTGGLLYLLLFFAGFVFIIKSGDLKVSSQKGEL